MKRIVVVGGGVSGLAVGALLQRRAAALPDDVSVTVLEAEQRPGGKLRSEPVDGFVVEWGPNGYLDREPKMRALVDELGLGPRLLPSNDAASKRYIYRAGALRKAPEKPPEIFTSDFLPLGAKLRMLCEPLGPLPPDDEDESVASFARRRVGRVAADVLINAFVLGIYGGDAERLSLRSAFPRMWQMEHDHGSLIAAALATRKVKEATGGPSGKLTSFRGGVSDLIDALAQRLGSALVCGAPAQSIARVGDGFVVRAAGRDWPADAVILAAPAGPASTLVAPLLDDSAAALAEIPVASISVVALGWPRQAVAHDLQGFGFLVPRRQGLRIIGSLWSSSIFDSRAPEGHVLVQTMIGGAADAAALELSDHDLLQTVASELGPLIGIRSAPTLQRIVRHPKGIPQYDVGHGVRVARAREVEQAQPGLYLSGNSLDGVAMIDCVRNAYALSDRVIRDLAVGVEKK